jgi:ubiquinone/menaquinone biosynthesis C-methylase UbiE
VTYEKSVSDHYRHGALLESIRTALGALGKTVETVTIEDLGPVDEFHIGGRPATKRLVEQLGLATDDHVLDVGCGLGGAARFVASQFGTHVSGIDLAQEYVETGNALCDWVRLADRISLREGSALNMPFEDESFDGGYMLHVGMNIEDKGKLFEEIARVLKPGARFAVYDIMRQKQGDLTFPVPWAAGANTNQLGTAPQYKQALRNAGFRVLAENDRRDFAVQFFQALRAKAETAEGPAPLGLHTLMQASTGTKINNMIENIGAGLVAPFEIVAQKS